MFVCVCVCVCVCCTVMVGRFLSMLCKIAEIMYTTTHVVKLYIVLCRVCYNKNNNYKINAPDHLSVVDSPRSLLRTTLFITLHELLRRD